MRATKCISASAMMLSLVFSATSFAQYYFAQDPMPEGVHEVEAGDNEVLADANGRTLYTFDHDTRNESTCSGRCAMLWPPLKAPDDAHSGTTWTVITRADGTKQWAYDGKPLYTSSMDKASGEAKGNNAGPNGTHVWHDVIIGY